MSDTIGPKETEDFLKKTLNSSPDFFSSFDSDSDWAFLIKLHTLVESSLNRLLISVLGISEKPEPIYSLDIGHCERGKIGLANSMNLLTPEIRKFMALFAKLRNNLAHDVKNTSFSLSALTPKVYSEDIRSNFKETTFKILGNNWKVTNRDTGERCDIDKEASWNQKPRIIFQCVSMVIMVEVMAVCEKSRPGTVYTNAFASSLSDIPSPAGLAG